jgi:hypothetical protein
MDEPIMIRFDSFMQTLLSPERGGGAEWHGRLSHPVYKRSRNHKYSISASFAVFEAFPLQKIDTPASSIVQKVYIS